MCGAGFTGINCETNIDECASAPCTGGGTCVDGNNSFNCLCPPGLQGTSCSINTACASIPCQHGGTCNPVGVTAFNCTCPAGAIGNLCQTDVNDCASSPCRNGGTCVDHLNGFTCTCPRAFSGSLCDTDINECASAPCLNGGACADGTASFRCTCLAGFSGATCQSNVNDCASTPCVNGGACVDAVNGFTCTCVAGWSGTLCQTNINECASHPCRNGGTCADNTAQFSCICPAGFSGLLCDTNINECASHPCLSGGTCVDVTNGFTCTCATGYSGLTCQTSVCNSSPCINGGTCTAGAGGFTCACQAGFSGVQCQTDINECASLQCLNGATCTDAVNGFSCLCAPGFSGGVCQTDINECASQPCALGASCVDGINGYNCTCALFQNGTQCQNSFCWEEFGVTTTDPPETTPITTGSPPPILNLLNFSFSIWFFPQNDPASSADQILWNAFGNGGFMLHVHPQSSPAQSLIALRTSASDLSLHTQLAVTSWTLVVVTATQARFLSLYVDGSPSANTNTDTSIPSPFHLLQLLFEQASGTTPNVPLPFVRDARIYDVTLTDPMVDALFLRGLGFVSSTVMPIPRLQFSFAEGSGTVTRNLRGTNISVNLDPNEGGWVTCPLGASGVPPIYIEFSACGSQPCTNGATCVDVFPQSFTCACVNGFSGPACQTNINECASQPCLNSGTCIDGVNSFTCVCSLSGFDPLAFCAVRDNCASSPCQNGATCVNSFGSFTCACPLYATGTVCQNTECWLQFDNTAQTLPLSVYATPVVTSEYSLAYFGFMNTTTSTVTYAGLFNSLAALSGPIYGSPPVAGIGSPAAPNVDIGVVFGVSLVYGSPPEPFGWFHSVITVDVNRDMRIYVDGGPAVDGGVSVALPQSMTIDGVKLLRRVSAPVFNTTMRDLQVFSKALNATQAHDLFVTGHTAVAPRQRVSMADGFGNVSADISGFGRNVSLFAGHGVWAPCPGAPFVPAVQTSPTTCASAPCGNNGECFFGVNSFSCSCSPGFSGTFCQTNTNECASTPCLNGGVCVDGANSFTCACVGFSGSLCQTDINECASFPCAHGGICTDHINGFTCACAAGFSGAQCQTDANECASHPCANGGICIDLVNAFTCTCAGGFSGSLCQTNVNECASHPCLNGASCHDGVNSVVCTCIVGFTGTFCQTNVDDCAVHPCATGATCVDLVHGFTCTCVPGFSGSLCDVNINECASAPCANGGTCVDGVNSFTCICAPGFSEVLCDITINQCASLPCANGATCTPLVNAFSCACPLGFNGTQCQNEFARCWDQTGNAPIVVALPANTASQTLPLRSLSFSIWHLPSYNCSTGLLGPLEVLASLSARNPDWSLQLQVQWEGPAANRFAFTLVSNVTTVMDDLSRSVVVSATAQVFLVPNQWVNLVVVAAPKFLQLYIDSVLFISVVNQTTTDLLVQLPVQVIPAFASLPELDMLPGVIAATRSGCVKTVQTVSNVAVYWNQQLNSSQVQYLVTETSGTPVGQGFSHLAINEGVGFTAQDLSGNGNTGALPSGVGQGVWIPCPGTDGPFDYFPMAPPDIKPCVSNPCQNNGLCFDSPNGAGFTCQCLLGSSGPVCANASCWNQTGDSSIIMRPAIGPISVSTLSIGFWYLPTSTCAQDVELLRLDDSGTIGGGAFMGTLDLTWQSGTTYKLTLLTTSSFEFTFTRTAGTWIFLVVTMSQTETRLYLDRLHVLTIPGAAFPPDQLFKNVQFLHNIATDALLANCNLTLQTVRNAVYYENYVLTPSQISWLGTTGIEGSAIADGFIHAGFTEGSGSTSVDRSGNGNVITLTSGFWTQCLAAPFLPPTFP